MDTHVQETIPENSRPQTSNPVASLITVIGVGGAGGNAVNNMIEAKLEGCSFVVANTDSQALEQSACNTKIQLGPETTKGLGAGAKPEVGTQAAEETLDEIKAAIEGSSMLFITAGMGGGTGTGAAPVVARIGQEAGLLTVGVVCKPFAFEGSNRMKLAEAGIAELSQHVDTLIVIPNQNLFQITDDETSIGDAFKLADDVLLSGVRGVTDLVVLPGLINLDFADIRSIMTGMGKAVMGTGKAKGDNRAVQAAELAISNPLLDDVSVKGARSVLINITGGPDLSLVELDKAANRIRSEVDPEANIIFGSAYDENLDGVMRVSVIATGKDVNPAEKPAETSASTTADKPYDQSMDKLVDQAADKPNEQSTDKPVDQAADKPNDQSTDKPVDQAADKPAAQPAEKPAINVSGNVITENASIPAKKYSTNIRMRTAATNTVTDAAPMPTNTETATATAAAKPIAGDGAAVQLEEPPAPDMRFIVCDLAVGVRIYKVPYSKVAQVRSEAHSDRMQIFNSLEKAKGAADNLCQRIAYKRAAEGLPQVDPRSPTQDYDRWTETDVPLYYY